MKTIRILTALISLGGLEAGEFVNLDFDSVDSRGVSFIYGNNYTGDVAKLIPGWSVQLAPNYVNVSVVGYSISPGGFYYKSGVGVVPTRNGGGYSVGLTPYDLERGAVPVRLSQSGIVPVWAKAIEINGDGLPFVFGINDVEFTLNGDEHWVDISRYSGQTVELSLKVISSSVSIDSLRFVSVPEPSSISMCLYGGGFVCLWMLRRRC